jgi:hypothetical protein
MKKELRLQIGDLVNYRGLYGYVVYIWTGVKTTYRIRWFHSNDETTEESYYLDKVE